MTHCSSYPEAVEECFIFVDEHICSHRINIVDNCVDEMKMFRLYCPRNFSYENPVDHGYDVLGRCAALRNMALK